MKIVTSFNQFVNESTVTEARRGTIHSAAKKASYPVTLVATEKGKVVDQKLVGTPMIVPAAFNMMQEEFPNATISVESKTGQIVFSESVVTEGKFDGIADLVKSLHFEVDPKTAEEKKIELGRKQGEVSKRKQIESAEYSLRRFRKEIKYGDGKNVDVFLPDSYDASASELGNGPHAKAVKKVKWNQRKYDQWLEDMAANGGADNAFDMAQNAKNEPGLIYWVTKEFRGEDPMQRIQWDIEAFSESAVTEAKLTPRDTMMELLSKKGIKSIRNSEDFDGVDGGIWIAADNGERMSGKEIFDYYADSSSYSFGVLNNFVKFINKHGWYAEYYDPGTIMLWEE